MDTGEPLPRALFDRMVAARHFHSAVQMLRQCEFALFDMRLHAEPGAAARVQQVADEVRRDGAAAAAARIRASRNSFSHLFCGGYAAGYYGYAWAEVLSADAYGAFEEAGIFDPATGERFRRRSWKSVAAARRWRAFAPSAAATRRSTRCCDTRDWLEIGAQVG